MGGASGSQEELILLSNGKSKFPPRNVIGWESGLFLTDRRFTGQRWEGGAGPV